MSKDELKQLYDEKETLRDKIIDEVKEKVNEFKVNICGASNEFVEAFNGLTFSLDGYSGKRNYNFISREQKEKVDAVVKVVCKDDNLQELYRQWCQLQLANLRYYHKHPEKSFDSLEKNKNFENRLKKAVLKPALKDSRRGNVYIYKFKITEVKFVMKREKMTFNVPPVVRTEIKNYVKLLGFKSESDLCNKAVNSILPSGIMKRIATT